MSLGLPEIGTGSNYFSQYDSDITGLLSRIYDNNSNVILAKDVRDPIWSLWNQIQQVASQSLTASSLYSLGTPSTISVGGIVEGSTFSNVTINQLFDTMLLPYITPVVDSFGPSITEIQFGNTTPINLTYSINVGSVPLDGSYAIQFLSPNPSSLIPNKPVTGNDPETGKTNNFSLTYSTATISVIDYAIATMSFRTTDLTVFTSTTSIAQKHKRYYGQLSIPIGFTPSNPASVAAVASYLTDTRIKGLSYSELSTNVNFSQAVDFNTSGQYFIFAAPTVFGFNYPPGFYVDNVFNQNWTKIRSNSNFSNEFSYVAPYDVYIINEEFVDPALISTIPLPFGYLGDNFNNVINSVIIGDQGPQGATGPAGPGVSVGGATWSFQLNDGYGGLTGVGYFDFTNKSININTIHKTASNSTIIGFGAGEANTASDNTFVGYKSGATNSSGNYNSFVGSKSGCCNQTGFGNSFFGYLSGFENISGSRNTLVGAFSGCGNQGSENIFIGYSVGVCNIGDNNTFIGNGAGSVNTTGNLNIFIGNETGYFNKTGCLNTFVGNFAGKSNVNGCENIYIGDNSGCSATQSVGNTFVGYSAGKKNSGFLNTFIGNCSGYSNTSGQQNTFLGQVSGSSNTTGNYNTYLGWAAGSSGTSSCSNSRNTFIGANAGFTQSTSNICNSIAIGVSASVWKTGQLSIGDKIYSINTGTTASTCSAYTVPTTATSFLCVTINGTEYKIALFT